MLSWVYSAIAKDGKAHRPEGGYIMKSAEYATGMAVGIIAALALFFIIWKFNKTKLKGQFDERQELVRGRGYKYACFTLLGLAVLDLLLEGFDLWILGVPKH